MAEGKGILIPIKIGGLEKTIKDTEKVKDSITVMQKSIIQFREAQMKAITVNEEFIDSMNEIGNEQNSIYSKAEKINQSTKGLADSIRLINEIQGQTKNVIDNLNNQSDKIRSKFLDNFKLFGNFTKTVEVVGEKVFSAWGVFDLWLQSFYKAFGAIGSEVPEITSALTGKKYYNEDSRKEDDKLESQRRLKDMNKMGELEKSLSLLVLMTQESISEIQESHRKALEKSLDDFNKQKSSLFYPIQGIIEGKNPTDDIVSFKSHEKDLDKIYNEQTNKILENIKNSLNALLKHADDPQDAALIKMYMEQLIPPTSNNENEESYWKEKTKKIVEGVSDGITNIVADKIEGIFEEAAPVLTKTVTGANEIIQDYSENNKSSALENQSSDSGIKISEEALNKLRNNGKELKKEQSTSKYQSRQSQNESQGRLNENLDSNGLEQLAKETVQKKSEELKETIKDFFQKNISEGLSEEQLQKDLIQIRSNLTDEKIKEQEELNEKLIENQKEYQNESLAGEQNFVTKQNDYNEQVESSMSDLADSLNISNEAILESTDNATESFKDKWSNINDIMQKHVDNIMQGVNAIFSATNAILNDQLQEAKEKYQAISEQYNEAVKEHKESSDKINALQEQAKAASGGRSDLLQEQIDKEMEKNQQLAQQEQNLAKEKEKAEKEKEKKEKQIKKSEISQNIIQGIANTALGVTKAWSLGPFIGPVMAAIVGAAGAIQVGVMTKQLAKLEDGGLLKGKRHSQGGMRIEGTNIEVEGGEYVINRESTDKNLALVRYINSHRKELTAKDLDSFFSKASTGYEPPFRTMFASGGQMPAISNPNTINNEALVEAIQSIKITPKVAVTDIIRVQDEMAEVQGWSGI